MGLWGDLGITGCEYGDSEYRFTVELMYTAYIYSMYELSCGGVTCGRFGVTGVTSQAAAASSDQLLIKDGIQIHFLVLSVVLWYQEV